MSATPPMYQTEEAECGAVSLAIVLTHHGAWIPMPQLRRQCEVSQHGTNASKLVEAAKSHGMIVRAMRVSVNDLKHLPAPSIILWNQHHFLVLEGVDGSSAYLNDPASGRRRVALDVLRAGYSDVAVSMIPGEDFNRRGTPPQDMSWLADHLGRSKWLVLILAASVLVESALLPVAVVILGQELDAILDGQAGSWLSFAIFAAALLVARAIHVGSIDVVIERASRPTIARVLDDLAHVPTAFLELRQRAELSGRLRLAETPVGSVTHAVVSGIRLCVGLPLWAGVLAWIDWRLAIALIVAFVLALCMQIGSQKIASAAREEPAGPRLRQVLLEADIWRQRGRIQANDEQDAMLSQALFTEPGDNRGTGARENRLAAIEPWVWSAAQVTMVLPALVAVVLGASGTMTIGGVIVTMLASWFCSALTSMPSSILGAVSLLPRSIAQLRDSSEEREFSNQQVSSVGQAP